MTKYVWICVEIPSETHEEPQMSNSLFLPLILLKFLLDISAHAFVALYLR